MKFKLHVMKTVAKLRTGTADLYRMRRIGTSRFRKTVFSALVESQISYQLRCAIRTSHHTEPHETHPEASCETDLRSSPTLHFCTVVRKHENTGLGQALLPPTDNALSGKIGFPGSPHTQLLYQIQNLGSPFCAGDTN